MLYRSAASPVEVAPFHLADIAASLPGVEQQRECELELAGRASILGNDYAITITYRKDETPSVRLWSGNGEFGLPDIEHFREFVAAAFELAAPRTPGG